MKNRAICRRCSVVLALVMVIWLSPAALAAVPDRPDNKYVLDTARVLSEGTERRIIAENQELFEECGGEIVVVAVDFLGGQDIEDYTYKMFNSWGVGSQERNNGILLVLAIGEENYYIQAGYGIEDYFDALFLSDILEEQLEPDFAAGDYDAGVKKTFDALISELRSYYDSGPGREEAPAPGQEYDYSDEDWDEDWGFSGLRELKTIAFALVRVVVIVAVLLFVFSLFRGSGGSGPRGGGGGGGFWRGMWLGSMLNGRRRTYWGPPPPPGGHRPGGFGGFGGFGGGSRGGFSGGGRSHGGGAGRGFGGGGGFHGGGGSHGGGAGRR